MTLEELAEKVERLEGPSREVDALIANQLILPLDWGMSPLRYTASLDAAMSLVPKGLDWMIDNFDGAKSGFRCSAGVFSGSQWIDCRAAATPALALTAASLRALSISRTTEGEGV